LRKVRLFSMCQSPASLSLAFNFDRFAIG
jgi:hypothetical protein